LANGENGLGSEGADGAMPLQNFCQFFGLEPPVAAVAEAMMKNPNGY